MKTFSLIVKIMTALAAIAGVVYVVATYGDKIVAWCKDLLAKCPCAEAEAEAEAEAAPEVEPVAEEAPAEEPAAEEVTVEEVVAVDEPVAEEADFAE